MKTIHTIMVLAAIMSVPMFFGTQAMAGVTGATGSVTIAQVCELTVGAMTFAAGDPISDGAGVGVGQLTVNLENLRGNLNSVTDVSGINWAPQGGGADVMNVEHTVWTNASNIVPFAGKLPLSTIGVQIASVAPAANVDTWWDVEIVLDGTAGFSGVAEQAITFDFACL